ncbi:hypothetical protein GTP81_15670 [Rugamonas sp. FT107W]|uniref:Uncharacterized protein n=1 Tax=Duganella vulcania TaxID=2692166 RepID=A0A845HHG6_9BURK|nr:hypothetical protein [Duganella vulcania]MYN18191.1 hypothetical protein [Duganella vulcania]
MAFFAVNSQAELLKSATVEQKAQIADAIKVSPMLATQFDKLTKDGKLTELLVVSSNDVASMQRPGPFNGWNNGSRIILTDALLVELAKNMQFDVRHEVDIYPNNTTFALGHLAYHLANKWEPPSVRPQDIGEALRKRLEYEAMALIQGWNDVVDAATRANGGRPLNGEQVGGLVLNLRYRAAIVQALQKSGGKFQFSQSGFIESNDANVKAIAAVLGSLALSDIE